MTNRSKSGLQAIKSDLKIIPAKGDLLNLGLPLFRSEMSLSQALEEQREERLTPDEPTESSSSPLESGTKFLDRLVQEGRIIRAQLDLRTLGSPLPALSGKSLSEALAEDRSEG